MEEKEPCGPSYLSLDKVVALCADVFEEIQDADCAFVLDLLKHAVNDNICSCAPNACTVEQRERREHDGRPIEGAVNKVSNDERAALISNARLAWE